MLIYQLSITEKSYDIADITRVLSDAKYATL
ncbi:MAG: hypothetical protein ACI9N9_000760 [Enterobacterales bacterium]|jgi:hypothetical protein